MVAVLASDLSRAIERTIVESLEHILYTLQGHRTPHKAFEGLVARSHKATQAILLVAAGFHFAYGMRKRRKVS